MENESLPVSVGRKFGNWLFRLFLFAAFAMWFGGLGFYMAWVVPIATDVLGSAFDQGMVTRQVTKHINVLAGVALLVMLVEAIRDKRKSSWRWRVKAGSVVLMLLLLGGLVWLHPRLDALIDLVDSEIDDYDSFYSMHRIYLWLTTVQWLAGWVWIATIVSNSEQAGPSKFATGTHNQHTE